MTYENTYDKSIIILYSDKQIEGEFNTSSTGIRYIDIQGTWDWTFINTNLVCDFVNFSTFCMQA